MQTSSIVLFLHVFAAFAAVGFLVVPGLMLEIATGTRDVPFVRKAYGIGSFHGRIGGPVALSILPLGIAALSATSPDAAPSPELTAALEDPLDQPMLWISALLWMVPIALMVFKPF